MATNKTISKGIRIKAEVAEYFSGKPLNRYIESMYEHIQDGSIEEEENGICVHRDEEYKGVQSEEKASTDSVHSEFKEAFSEITDSVKCYNLTGGAFLKKIISAMDKGKIVYEGGEFTVYDELDLSRFKAACDEKGVEYQKMIDKCTQMVWQI